MGKNNLIQVSGIRWVLLWLVLGLLACGRLQFGLEGPATPEQNLAATITVLQTEKAQLAAQLKQVTATPTVLATSTTLLTSTAPATLTPSPTPLPATVTPNPDQGGSQATSPPTSTSPPPTVDNQWVVRTLLVFPGVSGRLYALQQQTDPAPGLRLLTSDDFGDSWAAFPGVLPVEAACLHQLNLDYANLDALYASTCQGLYRWSGSTWLLLSSQETGMVAIVYGQPDKLWATIPPGPGDSPVLYSADSGQAWAPASRFLSHTNGVANLAFDPQNTNLLYAVIWPEYTGSYLRRGVASGQWEALPTPLNNAPIGTGLTLDGNSGALYLISEDQSSQLWRSPNPAGPDANTIQWERIYDFGQGLQVELLASGWSPQGVALYANLTGSTQEELPRLHRSPDGGRTWTPLPIEF